ncbi:MAG: Gfo/Idh/MocA family oxidoreductase [Phycisphaerae bacterium]|nr:Gfo/Idh/MocA family oxidoreductase [Phycisphaerae bacterium]
MNKLAVGIIGCGYICREHVKHILECPRMNVIGVADLNAPNAEEIKSLTDAEYATTDSERILCDPGIGAVLIFSSHNTHYDLIRRACEERKPFFVEKPLALKIDEARRILQWTRDSGVKHQVGLWMRHSPLARSVAESIPRPYHIYARCLRPIKGDFDMHSMIDSADPYQKSGYFDHVVYLFDVLCYLMPSDPARIQSFSISDHVGNTITSNIKFADGATASILCGNLGPGGFLKKWFFEILGGHCNAAIDNWADLYFSDDSHPSIRNNDYHNGFREQMKQFAEYVLDGGPSPMDAREASKATVLAELAMQSAGNNEILSIDFGDLLCGIDASAKENV